jgi:hypothetical protein
LLAEANLRPTALLQLIGELRARGVRVDGQIRNTADLLDALLLLPERQGPSARALAPNQEPSDGSR